MCVFAESGGKLYPHFPSWLGLALLSKSNLCVALYVWQCSSILPVDLVYGQVVNRRRRWVVSSFLDPIVKEPFPSFLPTTDLLRLRWLQAVFVVWWWFLMMTQRGEYSVIVVG